MEAKHYHIDRMPLPYPSYLKAVVGRRRYQEGQRLPQIRVEWPKFSFSPAAVKAYAKICATPFDGRRVPLLFPHSYFGPLHLMMMTDDSFPLKVLGAVHHRNHVLQQRPLRIGETYEARLYFMEERRRPQGIELDFRTEIHQGTTIPWESISTVLIRRKCMDEDAESPRAGLLQNLGDAVPKGRFPVPFMTGKQFGWITKDINPIHMSRYLARIFGFERDICHGMWALSRSLNFMDGIDWEKPVRNDVSFKGPLFMERDIAVKVGRSDSSRFELYSEGNDRPCVLGRLYNVEAKGSLI